MGAVDHHTEEEGVEDEDLAVGIEEEEKEKNEDEDLAVGHKDEED